jgi:hypothetical protein
MSGAAWNGIFGFGVAAAGFAEKFKSLVALKRILCFVLYCTIHTNEIAYHYRLLFRCEMYL